MFLKRVVTASVFLLRMSDSLAIINSHFKGDTVVTDERITITNN